MENKHTSEDLKIMQSWDLDRKIQVSQTRIMEWYNHFEGQVYVSFSGGKDSTVLLDLCRRMYPDIEAVFVDTGLEYPEIRDFVKSVGGVTWLKPEMNFREVLNKYGYPVISKEVSLKIKSARSKPDGYAMQSFDKDSPKNIKQNQKYSFAKYKYLIDSPFKISHQCCDIMKKKPIKVYEKNTSNMGILGTMTTESMNRNSQWLKYGCNAFEKNRPTSQPMSFWTESDVLEYLCKFNIPYCSVYGDIVKDENKYINTGLKRTGCMFCMFGVHLEKEPNRFQLMKETHPKMYDYCIREENGLGLGKVLDFIGVDYE